MSTAKIFASALHSLAEEENAAEEVLNDLKNTALIFKEHPDYIKILDSPQIERSELMRILNEDLMGKINKYTLNFIKLLCERHIAHKIYECADEYERLYNEQHNIKIVKVTTARPLSENLAVRLKKKLEEKTGGKIVLEKKIDEACIGGIIIESDGAKIDSSVKSEFSNLKRALTN